VLEYVQFWQLGSVWHNFFYVSLFLERRTETKKKKKIELFLNFSANQMMPSFLALKHIDALAIPTFQIKQDDAIFSLYQ